MNAGNSILRRPATADRTELETRFIAAVLKDGEGVRLQECRGLAADAFQDARCRRAWRDIVSSKGYVEAATSRTASPFFEHTTPGTHYVVDRDTLWISWLHERGLPFVQEWRATLPHDRSSASFPEFEIEPEESEVLETVESIISGLLEPGDKMSISSGSKSFKTWTLIQLGYAIQSGTPWLGFPTKKRRVLFLNFEIKPRNFWKRVFCVRRALGLKKSADFTVWNLRGMGFSMDSDADELIRRAKAVGAGVIILDPVYKLFGERNESSAGDMASLMKIFDKVSVETGAAIIYAHHFAKGNAAGKDAMDRQSGSGVFARDPDCLVSLTRLEESECANGFAVDVTLRDFAPVYRFGIRREQPAHDPRREPQPEQITRGRGASVQILSEGPSARFAGLRR